MQCLYNCKNTKCPWSKVMLYIPPHMGSRNSMVAVAACENALLTVKNRFYLYLQPFLCILIHFMQIYMFLFIYCHLAHNLWEPTHTLSTEKHPEISPGLRPALRVSNSQPNYSGRRRPVFCEWACKQAAAAAASKTRNTASPRP